MVKKIKSQMSVHFFSFSKTISTIAFLATFKLAGGSNRIHNGAAMWELLFYVNNALKSTLNNLTSAATKIAIIFGFVHSVEPL